MTIRIGATTFFALFLSLAVAGMASAQSIADPVPLLNGTEKAKLLYSIPYVYSDASIATCVVCTDVDKGDKGDGQLFAFEAYSNGVRENDVTLGEGVQVINGAGDTDEICTRAVASVAGEATMGTEAEGNVGGVGRVVATTNRLICTAFLVSVADNPPTFMTTLPMYKSTKQKGGM
jgi:hypothetical protein